ADLQDLPRPSALEHLKYVRGYLLTLTLCFGVGGLLMLGYNGWTAGNVEAATTALGDAETPSADQIKAAFEAVESPHLFGGWRVPDSILPEKDTELAGLDEEALVKAVLEAPVVPVPSKDSQGIGTCGNDTLCTAEALGKPFTQKKGVRPSVPQRVKVFRYLLLRRAMARGEAISPEQIRFFQWNRTLWVRAFRRQIMDGSGTPTQSDVVIIRDLIEILEGASSNGTVFGWYGTLSGLVFGLFTFLWIRRGPTYTVGETAAGETAAGETPAGEALDDSTTEKAA
ncbi:MAG: hypothetical protein ACI9WU_002637, partial [Myxococcota bacterium]